MHTGSRYVTSLHSCHAWGFFLSLLIVMKKLVHNLCSLLATRTQINLENRAQKDCLCGCLMLMQWHTIHNSSKHKLSYANGRAEMPTCDCEALYSHWGALFWLNTGKGKFGKMGWLGCRKQTWLKRSLCLKLQEKVVETVAQKRWFLMGTFDLHADTECQWRTFILSYQNALDLSSVNPQRVSV